MRMLIIALILWILAGCAHAAQPYPARPSTRPIMDPAITKQGPPSPTEPPPTSAQSSIVPASEGNVRTAAIREPRIRSALASFRTAIRESKELSRGNREEILKALDDLERQMTAVFARIQEKKPVGEDEVLLLEIEPWAQPAISALLNKPELKEDPVLRRRLMEVTMLPTLASGCVVGPDEVRAKWMEQLHLTPDQVQKVDALRQRYATEIGLIMERAPKKRSKGPEYFFASQQYQTDSIMLAYRIAPEFKAILTEEQLVMLSRGRIGQASTRPEPRTE